MNCKIGKLTAWFAAAVLVFGIGPGLHRTR